MSSFAWTDLEKVFHEALELAPGKRQAFLDERCADSSDLRAEIESLLRAHEGVDATVDLLPPARPVLQKGMRLGKYEVMDSLGSGGMGDVYRARDTRLNRTVAVKVVSPALHGRADLRDRFRREAEIIAGLNHPHICTLYDVAVHENVEYLVMEFVDGETLDLRLTRGPLPVDEALTCAMQIASALGQAHRHGIVHRDLKPGNVMLARASGAIHAKLLDFGVAKLLAQTSPTSDIGAMGLTVPGVIVGTPRYMAPEQLEARAVDHRGDIFAFGAVLFEMLVGRPAFEGQSTASIIAAVLTHHPAMVSTVRVGIPPTLDRVVKKCLSKNPDERWQSADDLASELKWIAERDTASDSVLPARRSSPWWMLAAAAGIAAAVAVLGTWLATRADPPARYRLTLVPPEGSTLVPGQPAVVSPDGRQIALAITEASGITRLYVRNLATAEIRAVEGTDQPTWPFWSPDARSLGFFADGKLKTIDVTTGMARTIADAPLGRGASWSRDDVIVFSAFNQDRLYRVSAFGGEKTPVTTIDAAHEFAHWWPEFLPDGRHFLYRVQSGDASVAGVYIGSLDGTTRRRLVATNGHAVFAAPGYLVFNRDTTVLAQAFDATGLELDGDPFVVTSAAPVFLGRSLLSASTNGLLVTTSAPIDLSLAWYDRTGRKVAELGEYSNNPHTPELSPDATRVLMSMEGDQWLIDSVRGAPTRITFGGADDSFGRWWPDGRSIVWASSRTGAYSVWRKRADQSREEEQVLQTARGQFPTSVSTDGAWMLVNGPSEGGSFDISAVQLKGEHRAIPVLNSAFEERGGLFAPDRQWFAYTSNEAGGPIDVFLARLPTADARIRVSAGGGFRPQWNTNGKELFYVDRQGRMMSVPIRMSGDQLEIGAATALFQTRLDVVNLPFYGRYSVAPDGQRFLMLTPPANRASNAVTVTLNWLATR